MLQRMRAIPGVVQAAPLVEAAGAGAGPRPTSGAIVRGMTPADLRGRPSSSPTTSSPARCAASARASTAATCILVGDRLAAAMGVGPGDTLTLTSPSGARHRASARRRCSKAFTVAGIFSVGMSQYDQAFIYMPLAQAQLFFGRGSRADYIEIKLDDPDKTRRDRAAGAQAAGAGARGHRLARAEPGLLQRPGGRAQHHDADPGAAGADRGRRTSSRA